MDRIYFDQASSCFPRPKEVTDCLYDCLCNYGMNVHRSASSRAYQLEELVFDCRENIADFFHAKDSRNVAFTKNITESLNIVIKGLFHEGDHILISHMEHNAVVRPLEQVKEQGISYDFIQCYADGSLDISDIEQKINKHTKAVILTHASNVCGTIMPLKEVGTICRKRGLLFIVDSAQTAGRLPIHMDDMHIDILCFTGHKSLMGPPGTGGIVFANKIYQEIRPLIAGGTGSISDSIHMPTFMPDMLEAGTQNNPAIVALNRAVQWIQSVGMETIHAHEMRLADRFMEGIHALNIRILGMQDCRNRLAVVSLYSENDMALIANQLEEKYGIVTRVGLHCAPVSHQCLGSFPNGSIRFSFGYFNTMEEVDFALHACKEILWK